MNERYVLNEQEIKIIRCLQEEFPLCEEPFKQIAAVIGIEESEVIRIARGLQEKGCLKRLAAVLYHTTVGYAVNAMIAWDVPAERIDEIASQAAVLRQVSHCYQRSRDPGFDYNFYTMVHAKSEEELQSVSAQLQSIIQPRKCCSLKTQKELKKKGMKYF